MNDIGKIGQSSNIIANLIAGPRDSCDMNLSNKNYVISISTKSSTEYYYRDDDSWIKMSSRGQAFQATAEQVLNHVLPVLANIKPNVTIRVEHFDDPGTRLLVGLDGVRTL
jgi:hypothetical protein